MKVLLDTHCWLWMQAAPERFSDRARSLLLDDTNELLFSAASSWEIAVKYAQGKLDLPDPPSRYVPSRLQGSGVTPIPIEHVHALRVAELPFHHRDPFDRLLIAQSQLERAPLLTVDDKLRAYDVELIWAS